jgi:hypothetical protein
MATNLTAPLADDLWYTSIDDLLAPLPEKPRLGGAGPFVINLSSSTAGVGLPALGLAACQDAHAYEIQRNEDGRTRYRLRLGPFESEEEADAILDMVRELYPSALTATAGPDDLKAIASIRAKAAASSDARRTAMREVTTARAPIPAPIEIAAKTAAPVAAPVVAPHAIAQATITTPTDAHAAIPTTFTPPVLPVSTAVASRPTSNVIAQDTELSLTLLEAYETPAPKVTTPIASPEPEEFVFTLSLVADEIEAAAPKIEPIMPASAAAPTLMVAPTLTLAPTLAVAPTLTLAPTLAPAPPLVAKPAPAATATSAAASTPEAMLRPAATPSPALKPTASPLATAPRTNAAATKQVGPPMSVSAPMVNRRPGIATAPPTRVTAMSSLIPLAKAAAAFLKTPVGGTAPPKTAATVSSAPSSPSGKIAPTTAAPSKTSANATAVAQTPKPSIDSTQTMRALTSTDLNSQSLPWFVIELSQATEAFDPDTVPNLDIFSVYRLYCVANIDNGQVMHALRVGFFSEETAAKAVASYLAAYYDKPAVKRVSIAERERFAEQAVEARKDVGATGRHAVIEITDDLVARRKRSTEIGVSP